MTHKRIMGRRRPRQHSRRLKSGRRVAINIGVPAKLPEGVSKKQAREVITNSRDEIVSNLKRGRSVRFDGIGIIKIKRIKARSARKGINPFTGKEQMFKAKPASRRVKIVPTSILKEAVK